MKIVVQRAKKARVIVDGNVTGEIEKGLMLLVGITHKDTVEDLEYCAKKVANMRIFEDADGKMNLSVKEVGGLFYPCHSLRYMVTHVKEIDQALLKLLVLKLRNHYMINLMSYYEQSMT